MGLRLFVDFDGTIARDDVGELFFRHFGGQECIRLVGEYKAGRLSARECFQRQAACVGRVAVRDIEEFIDGQAIDPAFPEFMTWCRETGVPLTVVSDGLDLYIHRVLTRHGLAGLDVVANGAVLSPQNSVSASLVLSFPYTTAECDRCACCKRDVLLTRSGAEDIVGYIGDGYSDRCPVQYADLVFAKKELQTFCQRENIPYHLYESFADVKSRLVSLSERKGLRRRKRAELLRRDAFLCEW